MKQVNMQPINLAYIQLVGPYGQGIPQAIDRINQWANNTGISNADRVHIFHDDPEVTPPDECRSDIGVVVPSDMQVTNDIKYQQIPGGRYIVEQIKFTDVPQIIETWDRLIEALPTLGLCMDNRPCFEVYTKSLDGEHAVSVYISIKEESK